MLHGLASDHTGLLELAGHLTAFSIVAVDLPGFGRSEALSGRHTLDRYADVVEELRQHLGLATFALLGHSLGSDVALAYAARHGSTLDSLCLLNPVIEATTGVARIGRFLYTMSTRLPSALAGMILTSRPSVYVSDRMLFTTRDRATRRRILRQDFATARLSVLRAVQESYLSLGRAPFAQYASLNGARTLLLTGNHDPLCTPGSLSTLSRKMTRATVQVMGGTGHMMPAERPAAAAAVIDPFLRSVDSGGAVELPADSTGVAGGAESA